MSGIFSILSDGQAGLFRLQQARRAAAGGTGTATTGKADTGTGGENAGTAAASTKTGSASSVTDGTRHLSELLAKGSSDSLTDFMRGASTALNAMKQAMQVSQPKARAEEKLQDAERRIKELRNEMRMAAARGDRAKVMQLAKEAAALAKQAGSAAKEFGRGVAASADMAAGGGISLPTQATTSTTTTVEMSQTTATVTLTAGTGAEAGAAAAARGTAEAAAVTAAVTAEAPPPVPVEAPPAPSAETGADTAQTATPQTTTPQTAAQAEKDNKGGGDLATAINAAVAAVGGGSGIDGGGEGKKDASATGQETPRANPFQAQMDANAQRTARFRETDTFARRVEMVLAAVKNVLGEAKASNAYDTDHTRRKNNREELKQYDKVVEEADKAVLELRASAFGTPGGNATAMAGVTADADTAGADTAGAEGGTGIEAGAGAVTAAVPVPAGTTVNVLT